MRIKYFSLNLLMVFVLLIGCNIEQKQDYFIKIIDGDFDEVGVESGYINSSGDTVISLGKYYYCYTDTFRNYAIVIDHKGICIAIDKNEKELFEVYWYDNGPDYIAEGLFRIIKDGKIGYANKDGEIVIKPQFYCAFPFNNGKAKVSLECSSVEEGEHIRWESDNWFFIDKSGQEIK